MISALMKGSSHIVKKSIREQQIALLMRTELQKVRHRKTTLLEAGAVEEPFIPTPAPQSASV